MKDETKNHLLNLAKKSHGADNEDFNPMDYCGGNFDDAFAYGERVGEIRLAQLILETEGIEF